MAAEILASTPGVPPAVIERGLSDPDDRARAAVARLAGAQGHGTVPLLLQAATSRRWPLAQEAALTALRSILGEDSPIGDQDLERFLSGVAALDPPPIEAERGAFGALARAIGIDRLADRLTGPDRMRVGAARMLWAEGGAASLRALRAVSHDPIQELRNLGSRAGNLLGQELPFPEAASGAAGQVPVSEATEPSDDELILALAVALSDPEEIARRQAQESLENLPRSLAASWAARTLREGSSGEAAAGAAVAELLGLTELALPLLDRGSTTPAEHRGPFLRALGSLGMEPASLASVVASVDPAGRPIAVRLAWQVAGRTVLPFLAPLLEDTAGPVRVAVLEVFDQAEEPSARGVAEQLLKSDSSASVRAAAVHALARSGSVDRVSALALALADPDPDVRSTAVDVLPQGIAGEAARLLASAFGDQDERVWGAAVRHLAALPYRHLHVLWDAIRTGDTMKREELVRAIERSDPHRLAQLALDNGGSPESTDRALSVQLAARAGTPECTRLVVTALSDPDPAVRRTAAMSMSSLRSPSGREALARTMSDPQAEVRVEAIRALGLIDDDEVPAVLIQALRDPEVRVREMAAEALSRWRSPAVARRMAEALSSPDLRYPAGDVLRSLGAMAVEPLVDVVMGNDPEAAAAAGILLERISGAQPFVDEVASTDPGRRLRAVEVLGAIGGSTATQALLGALTDPDPNIRGRAATLLGELGDPKAVPPLKAMFLKDPVVSVAEAAREALVMLGSVPPGRPGPPEDQEEPDEAGEFGQPNGEGGSSPTPGGP
jgi:HEAT repeat protein